MTKKIPQITQFFFYCVKTNHHKKIFLFYSEFIYSDISNPLINKTFHNIRKTWTVCNVQKIMFCFLFKKYTGRK